VNACESELDYKIINCVTLSSLMKILSDTVF